eukprot:Clim_evm14s250 gene=Clim_evmTU14s250
MKKIGKGLFVGAWADAVALRRTNTHGETDITHVVSVCTEGAGLELPDDVQQMVVPIFDDEYADLLGHVSRGITFMQRARDQGGSVLIHCVQGVSRSPAFCAAYLIASKNLTAEQAVETLTQIMPGAGPNDGFLRQLSLLAEMGGKIDDDNPAYRAYKAELIAREMEMEGIVDASRFAADPKEIGVPTNQCYRCKKCRRPLLQSMNILNHNSNNPKACTSFFVEPLKWMKIMVDADMHESPEQAMSGKLTCPSCQTRLGAFSWLGERCSCQEFVAPSFQIHKQRVDAPPSAHIANLRR